MCAEGDGWSERSLLAGQLLKGGHVFDQQGRTMQHGDVVLAKIGEGTRNRLTRHADDLPDLVVGQSHFDSVGGGHASPSVGPFQHQAGDPLRGRAHYKRAELLVGLLALAA